MKRKIARTVSAAVCAALCVCACSSRKEGSAFTGDATEEPGYQQKLNAVTPEAYTSVEGLDLEPGTYISIIGKEEESEYWKQIQDGIRQAADDLNEELDYSGEDEIKVIYNAPGNPGDIDEQVNILDEELARYPDVIAISSIDEDASAVQFDLATMNGIPVTAFESGNTYQGVQCTCSTDYEEAVKTAAQKLCSSLDEEGDVILIVPDSSSMNSKIQVETFKKELAENHPKVAVLGVLYMDQLDGLKRKMAAEKLEIPSDDIQTASETVSGEKDVKDSNDDKVKNAQELLEKVDAEAQKIEDTEVVSWYFGRNTAMTGCMGTSAEATQLALGALEQTEGMENVKVVGFDAGKEQLEALENGELEGLLVPNPFGIGYAAVIAAARTVLQIGNEAEVDTGYVWVDSENMKDDNIQAMLYE